MLETTTSAFSGSPYPNMSQNNVLNVFWKLQMTLCKHCLFRTDRSPANIFDDGKRQTFRTGPPARSLHLRRLESSPRKSSRDASARAQMQKRRRGRWRASAARRSPWGSATVESVPEPERARDTVRRVASCHREVREKVVEMTWRLQFYSFCLKTTELIVKNDTKWIARVKFATM